MSLPHRPPSLDTGTVEELENDFISGDLDRLQQRACPVCGARHVLRYCVHKILKNPEAESGRRYQAGISIYCYGVCASMLCHLDGFCPSWAEEIEDWEAFSRSMNTP